MAIYTDLKIDNDDLVLDSVGEPELVEDTDCITQDIKHLIRDSGLMVQMIGQRNTAVVDDLLLQLTLMIEDDERLIPGTVSIEKTSTALFFIQAETYDFGPITVQAGGV